MDPRTRAASASFFMGPTVHERPRRASIWTAPRCGMAALTGPVTGRSLEVGADRRGDPRQQVLGERAALLPGGNQEAADGDVWASLISAIEDRILSPIPGWVGLRHSRSPRSPRTRFGHGLELSVTTTVCSIPTSREASRRRDARDSLRTSHESGRAHGGWAEPQARHACRSVPPRGFRASTCA